MGRIGMGELIVILIIIIFIFGGRKLPEIMRSLGESIKEFKKSLGSAEDKKDEEKK
ncbi:MAG: twin-arginine translocase TatA/TatE family subunit [Candidatus Omnitrophota bacterium]